MLIAGPGGHGLEVALAGPADGEALFFHHGTPSDGRVMDSQVQLGAARGLRHVVYTRPGYAGSERCPGRTIADCAGDVAAIADELGIERFFTIGLSGGGPHALASAALLPDRVIAVATMGSVAPRRAEGLDWLAGMGEENLEEFAAADAGHEALWAFLEQARVSLGQATAADLHAAFGDLLSEVDQAAVSGEFAEFLAAGTRAALAPGVGGWFDDDIASLNDWGFDLSAISPPATIWHGAQDRFVPFAHGKWLARHVQGARAQLHPDHGHLSIMLDAYGEVLDELLGSAG